MNSDHRDPQLDAAYQRASETEAGRPAAATRAAIMQEAAEVARRRAPAANDSRYLWRAVAALAVIGVAVLVWRQTDVRMPGAAPQMTVAAQVQGDAPSVPASADAVVVDATAARESATLSEPRVAARQLPRSPETLSTLPAATMSQDAEAPARTPLTEQTAAQLLREHFPTQFESAQFHRVWLVREADGEVLLSGELEAGQRYEDMRGQLRGLQGRTPGPWQVQQLRNGAGQLIELAFAEVELGEPSR